MMVRAAALVLAMLGFTLIELSAKLTERAGKDPEFRKRLRKDAKSVLAEELGREPTGPEVAEFQRLMSDA